MKPKYIIIKTGAEIDDKSNDLNYACEITDNEGFDNFITEVLNALAERKIAWNIYQIKHIREAIEQVMKEQGLEL